MLILATWNTNFNIMAMSLHLIAFKFCRLNFALQYLLLDSSHHSRIVMHVLMEENGHDILFYLISFDVDKNKHRASSVKTLGKFGARPLP